MLSKNQLKYIRSLKIKKYRQKEGVFLAEGAKIVAELLHTPTMFIQQIYGTADWIAQHQTTFKTSKWKIQQVSEKELSQISALKTPNQVLAIVSIPKESELQQNFSQQYTFVLDRIQDPGNLGTIIRIADWFGIPTVICSPDCADAYNPKVVQASMGSIFRTAVFYKKLPDFLEKNKDIPVYGALLAGTNLFTISFKKNGFIILGNESKGISPDLLPFIDQKVTIPKYGQAESLNAAISAGIIAAAAIGMRA